MYTRAPKEAPRGSVFEFLHLLAFILIRKGIFFFLRAEEELRKEKLYKKKKKQQNMCIKSKKIFFCIIFVRVCESEGVDLGQILIRG